MSISGSDKRDLIMPDELTKNELRDRWETPEGKAFRVEIIRQLQSEETGQSVDWKNLKVEVEENIYKWTEFDGVEEIKNNLNPFADLRGINLSFAELKKAYLRGASLEGANLIVAHLEGVNLFEAKLEDAHLAGAHLEGACLTGAQLEDADLEGADLNGADLHYAHFVLKSWVMRIAELNIAKFIKKLLGQWFFNKQRKATILIGAELKNVKLDGDPILYRDLLDEQYLDSFAKKYPKMYTFWLMTSNCGRSVFLLFVWTLVIGVIFGAVFANYNCPSWIPNFFVRIDPQFHYNGEIQTLWWQPYYMSFVTLTTLGLASAEPVNTFAFLWHTAQNMFGYIWLDYLIAVLGSKLTRRSA